MDDTLDEIFNQLVPREATAKEKDRYATALAGQYSTRFKELQALQKAVVYCFDHGYYVDFQEMQSAITEGQFVACYLNEELLCSGIIS